MGSRAMKGRYSVRKGRSRKKTIVLSIVAVVAAIMVAGTVGLVALCQSWLQDLPDYTNINAFNTSKPSTVYASDGTTVLAEFQIEDRTPVEEDGVSDWVFKGTVATEDERFYDHNGVDMVGIFRAIANNLLGGNLEGASTITQQFVRNTILSDEMNDISFERKIREMYISLKLEEQYSKDEILLMYLNTINYGSGAYGIEAASERYYSKHANELTLAEAATLVGIPQSPTYNNPLEYPDACLERRNLVLDRMLSNGYITQEEADAAKAEGLNLVPSEPSATGILAYPYFTSYVRNQLMDPNGKYGFTKADIFEGGLSIYTTLDVSAQQAAEEAAKKKLDEAGHEFEVALVAVDPDNGYIRALVGGKDYLNGGYDYESYQANMATGEGSGGRQSGSSFKAFTLVAALEAGINPNTLIDASAIMDIPGGEPVHNDSYANWGTTTIDRSFAVSSNTAFTRLILSIGVDKVIDAAERMGIESDMPHVSGLTLGVGSVNPLEMADAYATIANGGTHYEPECIERIVDSNDNVVWSNENPTGERAISPEVAHAAVEVMKGVLEPGGTGTAARLANGQPAAGKTGTTETGQDSWFCGITPQYSVAIWLGERAENYANARPVYATASSVFSDFLNKVLADQPIEQFPDADDPAYQKNYTDEEYHIYGTGYSGYSSGYSGSSYYGGGTTSQQGSGSSASSSGATIGDANGGGSSSGSNSAGGGAEGGTGGGNAGGGGADAGGGAPSN